MTRSIFDPQEFTGVNTQTYNSHGVAVIAKGAEMHGYTRDCIKKARREEKKAIRKAIKDRKA